MVNADKWPSPYNLDAKLFMKLTLETFQACFVGRQLASWKLP